MTPQQQQISSIQLNQIFLTFDSTEYILNSLFYHLISILIVFVLLRHAILFFLRIKIFRKYACLVYHFKSGLALFIDCLIILTSSTWDRNFSSVCSNRAKISPRFTWDEIFVYNCNSTFTLSSLTMRDEISSQFNELKFQPGLKTSI